MIILGNLDQEARWGGAPLPMHVVKRISAAAAVLAALAPEGEPAEIWTPAAVEPGRLRAAPGWTPPTMRVGTPPRWDLAWADPEAKAVNDRRFALALAAELGVALPGARVIESLDELDAHLAARDATDEWVCKAPWTAAGRDRARGRGPQVAGELRVRLERLRARSGALVFEPWLERIVDVGTCATVARDGTVAAQPPHTLLTDPRGGFLGIDLALPPITEAERDELARVIHATGAALARAGYAGPFTIDAFVYRAGDSRRLQPLCEINARYSFGAIARALGVRSLGFTAPPPDATMLVAPAEGDPVTVWVRA